MRPFQNCWSTSGMLNKITVGGKFTCVLYGESESFSE